MLIGCKVLKLHSALENACHEITISPPQNPPRQEPRSLNVTDLCGCQKNVRADGLVESTRNAISLFHLSLVLRNKLSFNPVPLARLCLDPSLNCYPSFCFDGLHSQQDFWLKVRLCQRMILCRWHPSWSRFLSLQNFKGHHPMAQKQGQRRSNMWSQEPFTLTKSPPLIEKLRKMSSLEGSRTDATLRSALSCFHFTVAAPRVHVQHFYFANPLKSRWLIKSKLEQRSSTVKARTAKNRQNRERM